MVKIHKIFGSPGTGKTTYLAKKAEEFGTGWYIVYNRAMQHDATERFAESIEVKTLHSTCYHLLGLRDKDMLPPDKITMFLKEHGIESVDQDFREEGFYNGSSLGGRVMSEIDKARNTYSSPGDVDGFDGDIVGLWEEYKDWKGSLYDYTDMLEYVDRSEDYTIYPQYLFIDEAQDYTPLMWHVIDKFIHNTANDVFIAGDEYQKIYGMRGVGDDFYLHNQDEEVVLTKSYRLKRAVYDHAFRMSDMMVNIHPREIDVQEGGEVGEMEMEEMIDYLRAHKNEKIFILGRTKYSFLGLRKNEVTVKPGLKHILTSAGIPYLTLNDMHSGLTPWSPKFVDKFNSYLDYVEGKKISRESAIKFALKFPAETASHGKIRLKHGIKASLERLSKESGLVDTIDVNEMNGWFTVVPSHNELFNEIFQPAQRSAIIGYGETRPPDIKDINIFADTIHASKGMEADTVFIDKSISGRVKDSLVSDDDEVVSDEYKVWFTGATRARNKLFYFDSEVFDYKFPVEDFT